MNTTDLMRAGDSAPTRTRPAPAPQRPPTKPATPHFACGPCARPPGPAGAEWRRRQLGGRSHLSQVAQGLLVDACSQLHTQLQLPPAHRVLLVPGSASGAVEAALWSLLGPRSVDVVAWETWGRRWHGVVKNRLGLELPVRLHHKGWGMLPPLQGIGEDADLVLVVNGTGSGVCMHSLGWIARGRQGLVIADVSSAAFCMPLDWGAIDAGCLSFQKGLGSEAHFGAVVLGPRAVARLQEPAPRPVPRLLDLRLISSRVLPHVAHTPTLMGMADLQFALDVFDKRGGLDAAVARTRANHDEAAAIVDASKWLRFTCEDESLRSTTPLCLSPLFPPGREPRDPRAFCQLVCNLLEAEGAVFDALGSEHAPPGFSLWCGPTVERESLACAVRWLEWGVAEVSRWNSA